MPLHKATLERMIETVQKDLTGVLVVDLPDGRTARLERTSAMGRALLLTTPGEDLDKIIQTTHGVRHESPDRYWPPAAPPKPAAQKPQDSPAPSAKPAAAKPPIVTMPTSAEERTLLGRLKSALRPN